MKLTYDKRAGAAYLDLHGPDQAPGRGSTEQFLPPGSTAGDDYFVLDFDAEGRLVGIEILVPSERLLPSVLADAEEPTS
jgi:uncharacterized protein YuzE